jgi:EAL domain-containing protein (putative c-di-GMP-specific phosphodiesterase class I)
LLSDKNVKDASDLAEKLCKALAETVTEVNRQSVLTTCSIGIALVLASAASPQDVLSDAHTACMEASKRGGNSYEVYKAVVKTDQGGLKTSEIAKMIETSIEENRLSLRYQPIVNLHGETQEIYEVFLRMVDVKGETVPTNMLFSSAEQAGLTIHLDKWVLKEAAKTLMTQHQEGHQTSFFIKLSDQAIRDENVILYIRKLLKSIQLSGDRFIFEISETSAINQIKLAKAFITTLKTMGCRSALEHFGTALNPKQTLSHLPVDYVKIDSSFSKGLSTNPENRKAIEDIVKMAHESKKLTIAEAVEDANSLTVLWQCEVDFAQGHYIQPPAEELDFDFSDE